MPEDPVLGGLSEELTKFIEDPASFTAAQAAAPSAAAIMKGLKIKGLSPEEKPASPDAPAPAPAPHPEAPPAPPEEPEPPPSAEALEALRADLPQLGLFGLLVAISDAPAPSEDVHKELPAKIAERIRTQLAEDRAKAQIPGGEPGASPVADGLSLRDLFALYREDKGASGGKVARKLLENTMYDFYDLKDHGLFIDDVARVVDLFGATTGEHDNIKSFVKRLAALSSDTSKFMLGLFPEQIALIHKVISRQAERKEIDDAFEGFGPRAIWKRILAIVKTLIQKEKRLRLAITVWARMNGVAITREQVLDVEKYLAVKDVRALVKRALARAEARRALIEFRKAHAADIAALEATF